MKKLEELLRKNLKGWAQGRNQLFIMSHGSYEYYVGWYHANDSMVFATLIEYPASSPAGYIRRPNSRKIHVSDNELQLNS